MSGSDVFGHISLVALRILCWCYQKYDFRDLELESDRNFKILSLCRLSMVNFNGRKKSHKEVVPQKKSEINFFHCRKWDVRSTVRIWIKDLYKVHMYKKHWKSYVVWADGQFCHSKNCKFDSSLSKKVKKICHFVAPALKVGLTLVKFNFFLIKNIKFIIYEKY